MKHLPRRAGTLMGIAALGLLWACGGRQNDFGAIGFGWPVQCGEVRQQYRDRVAAAESNTPPGAPEGARHLAVSVSAEAISETASVIVEDYERQANTRLSEFIMLGGRHRPTLDLDAGDVRLINVNGSAAVDIAVTGSLALRPASDDGERQRVQLALSARLVVGLGLVDDAGTAEIVVVPSASGFYDIGFGDDLPEADYGAGDGGASGPIGGAVQEGVRNVLEERVQDVRLLRVEAVSLGETGVTLTPNGVRALESTQELVVTFRTNLPVDVAKESVGLIGDQDVAVWADGDVLGPMLRTLTESIGGRAVDRTGRAGGPIRAFINSAETGDGVITLVQEGYNLKSPCSWTVTRMVAGFAIEGESLEVTIHDLRPIAASRQRWIVRRNMPEPTVVARNMGAQLGQNITPPGITLTGRAGISIRLTDVVETRDGVVVRAVIDTSSGED